MRPLRTLALLSVLFCLFPAAGHSEFQVVDDMSGNFRSTMLDQDNCSYRFRFKDNEHASSNVYSDHYFIVDKILDFRNTPADGSVYSQSFEASIGQGDLGFLYFGGALSQSAYNTLSNLFKSAKNPWDLKVSLTRNSSLHQLSLSYYWFNTAVGTNYGTTAALTKTNFTLESNCNPASKLALQSASASSSYSSSFGAEKMLDGDGSTYWIGANAQPSYSATFDLGSSRKLKTIEIAWYTGYAATNFDVELSTDGNTFVKIGTALNAVSSVDLANIKARYVRLAIRSLSSGATFPVIKDVSLLGW